MPDELETLMMLRERADAAYGKYLELADAAHKALRQKDYASADYERCLQFMINNLQFNEPVPREKIESHTDDSNGP